MEFPSTLQKTRQTEESQKVAEFMEGRDASLVVTCKVCAVFFFMPENNAAYTCSQYRLIALSEEKVKELEERVARLKAKREDEEYIGRILLQQQHCFCPNYINPDALDGTTKLILLYFDARICIFFT